jgi:hypothetical protein
MNDTIIPARWLPVIRAVWLVLLLLILAIFIAGISPLFNELRVACSEENCNVLALSPQEAQVLMDAGLSVEIYAWYNVGFQSSVVVLLIPLAGLILWRRSDSWMGILVSLTLVSLALNDVTALVRLYPSLRWPLILVDYFSSLLFVLLFYLFPDGRFVPRWTRMIVIALVGAALVDMLRYIRGPLTLSVSMGLNIFWLGCLIVGVLAQIYRYRRVSSPTQRQQTKWIMFGLTLAVLATLIWSLFVEIFPLQPGPARLAYYLSVNILAIGFMFFPISMVISILRYRLWDIDILINRTLVYGLLTGVLALLYFGSVVLLQSLFRALSGQVSPLAIVISTLVIAALFSPLRLRVQQFIDRRFFRRKYDAEKTLAGFAATMRDEVDLDKLCEALSAVVEGTMQPTHVSLWLAEPEKHISAWGEDQL